MKKIRIKFKNNYANKKVNHKWIVLITFITFITAIILGYVSIIFMDVVSVFGAIGIVLLITLLGVFFDLLGIAVTAAEERPFHSMAASKVRGAKESIVFIRNAGAVANFFNDVIGDISGIISGSAAAAIVVKINIENSSSMLLSITITAVIAALTVGGKAVGKEIALRNANFIVYRLGYLYSLFRIRKNT